MTANVLEKRSVEFPKLTVRSWLFEREDRGFLALTRTRFQADRFTTPNANLDPREWLSVRNQGRFHSACGMALATCLEVSHWLKTGSTVSLSGDFAYLASQRLSGVLGRDVGATVCGTVKAAKVLGACRDKLFPPTQAYRDSFAARAGRNALRYRVLSHSMLTGYRDVHRFLAAGLGPVLLAVAWRESLASAGAVIECDDGQMLGRHVVSIVGISASQRDEHRRPYLIVANSQGRRWGDQGFALAAPRLFDDWAGNSRDTLIVGLSDLGKYASRVVKHSS
jgi:hypothetical protein